MTIRHINYRIASSGLGEKDSLPVIVCSEKADDNISTLVVNFVHFMARKFIETDNSLGLQNPNIEYRNTKQYRITKILTTKTGHDLENGQDNRLG